MVPTAAVDFKDLDKFFGPFQALKDISMPIVPGKVTCLIGPLGSLIRVRGLAKAEARAVAALTKVGLADKLQNHPSRRRSAARGDCPRPGDGTAFDAV